MQTIIQRLFKKTPSSDRRLRRNTIVTVLMAGLVLGMGLSGVGATVNADSAEAAATYTTFKRAYGVELPKGTGRPYGGWVGTFTGKDPSGEKLTGFCLDRNKRMATATDIFTNTSKLPDANSAESKQIRYLSNKYAGMKDDRLMMVAAFAVWTIQDPTTSTYINEMVAAKKVTKAERTKVKQLINESKLYGPYLITATSVKVVGEGETTTVTVKVTVKRNGQAAPADGIVKFNAKNAKVISIDGVKGAKSGTTNTKGIIKAVIKVTGSGKVVLDPSVTYPSSTKVLMNKTGVSNSQRIVGGNLKETAKTRLTFQKKVGAPTYTTVCNDNCDGTAQVKVEVCNDKGNSPTKYAILANSKRLGYLSVGAGKCASEVYDVKDADNLTSKFCHTAKVGGDCTTGWTKVPGSYTVECPAWATAEITLGCNCSDSWVSGKFSAPADSTRYYRAKIALVKDGAVIAYAEGAIPTGKSTKLEIPMKVSAGVVIEARFSVFKDAEMKQAMLTEEVLTQVMVLKVSGKNVTFNKTTTVGGELVDSSTKTVKVDNN